MAEILVCVTVILCFALYLFKDSFRGWISKWEAFRFKNQNNFIEIDTHKKEEAPIPNKEQPASEKEFLKEEKKKEIEIEEPKTTEEANLALFHALFSNERDKEKKVAKAHEKILELETDPIKKRKYQTTYLELRYKFLKDKSALDKLKELTKDPQFESDAHESLGSCYEYIKQFDTALEEFNLAFSSAKSEGDAVEAAIAAADCLFILDRRPDAYRQLESILGKVVDSENLARLYEKIATFYEKENNHEYRAMALLKVIECKPDHTEAPFGVAYSFSEAKMNELSLIQYQTAQRLAVEKGIIFNNIGVQYERLNMPINSIESYKKAITLKETLAAANLAYRYMEAGFQKEAADVLDSVKSEKYLHPNVGNAISDLGHKTEEEEGLLHKAEVRGLKEQRFLSKFALYYFNGTNSLPSLSGSWAGDTLKGTLSQNGFEIELILSKDTPVRKITSVMHNLGGKALDFSARYARYGSTEHIGYSDSTTQEGYIYCNETGDEISIMFLNKYDNEPEFLVLKKLSADIAVK